MEQKAKAEEIAVGEAVGKRARRQLLVIGVRKKIDGKIKRRRRAKGKLLVRVTAWCCCVCGALE